MCYRSVSVNAWTTFITVLVCSFILALIFMPSVVAIELPVLYTAFEENYIKIQIHAWQTFFINVFSILKTVRRHLDCT
jgi:hypothetical protein